MLGGTLDLGEGLSFSVGDMVISMVVVGNATLKEMRSDVSPSWQWGNGDIMGCLSAMIVFVRLRRVYEGMFVDYWPVRPATERQLLPNRQIFTSWTTRTGRAPKRLVMARYTRCQLQRV